MGSPTKVQLIRRTNSEQWFVTIPTALAQALQLAKGEPVEWLVADKGHLILERQVLPINPVDLRKKNL
jgi:antitoxin component of MazEF toxin-antitoxin module